MAIYSGRATLAGVIGWPVAHSRSPRIHNFWLERHQIDGAYVPLPVRPEALARALDGLRACGFAGVNVTLPHKLAAFAECSFPDELARRVGAVNTLTFREGRIEGTNTDCFGFLAALDEAGVKIQTDPALVLGAGGAARAVAVALMSRGVPVTIANRTERRAEQIARDLPGVALLPWTQRSAALMDFSLLVNTTSLGMHGQPPLEIDLDCAGPRLAVADIVYTPLETELLKGARERGLCRMDGLAMLLHQARPAFASWFGIDPVVDSDLRQALITDLADP